MLLRMRKSITSSSVQKDSLKHEADITDHTCTISSDVQGQDGSIDFTELMTYKPTGVVTTSSRTVDTVTTSSDDRDQNLSTTATKKGGFLSFWKKRKDNGSTKDLGAMAHDSIDLSRVNAKSLTSPKAASTKPSGYRPRAPHPLLTNSS